MQESVHTCTHTSTHIATAKIVDAVTGTISILTLKKDGLGPCLLSVPNTQWKRVHLASCHAQVTVS